MASRWQPEMGKTDVGDMERRCQRDRDGPPPQSLRGEEGETDSYKDIEKDRQTDRQTDSAKAKTTMA